MTRKHALVREGIYADMAESFDRHWEDLYQSNFLLVSCQVRNDARLRRNFVCLQDATEGT